MSALPIPMVTLEDLQAFQAKHFPGHEHPLTYEQPPEEIYVEEEEEEEEDGLGYYPDGVKRTLTDEQIEIFRHSEIHALLRARQLREDELAYERRAQSEGQEKTVSEQVAKEKDTNNPAPEEPVSKKAKSIIEDSADTGPAVSEGSRKNKRAKTATSMSNTLDYDEDIYDDNHKQKSVSSATTTAMRGRRIVSYDD